VSAMIEPGSVAGGTSPSGAEPGTPHVAGAYRTNSEIPPAVRRTIAGDVREIVEELRHSGDLIKQLTLRDIRIRYKQAVFGFAWALLIPVAVVLAGMAVRVAVSVAAGRVLEMSQLAGMAIKAVPWAFFVGCLNTGTTSLVSNTSLVTKIFFPREVLPIASVLAQTFDSLIGGLLIACLLPFFGVTLSLQILWAPVLLALLWMLALAFALFLSRANLFFRDVKYIVQVFLTFGIFITPVLLDAPMFGPKGARLIMFNPVAPILEGLRLSVVEHRNLLLPIRAAAGFPFWQPWHLAYSAAWAIGGLAISALLFHRSERRFAEAV
jgi:lipopolysaccharide transport system permease protein